MPNIGVQLCDKISKASKFMILNTNYQLSIDRCVTSEERLKQFHTAQSIAVFRLDDGRVCSQRSVTRNWHSANTSKFGLTHTENGILISANKENQKTSQIW